MAGEETSSLYFQPVQLSASDFDFQNRRELPTGGFARVFAVRLVNNRDVEVAVKIPQLMNTSDTEIVNLERIRHRNIVRFFGTVDYDDRKCLVLELATMGSVSSLVKNGSLSVVHEWRDSWLRDVARATKYMHNDAPVSLVHGDIKGGNILIFSTPEERTVAKVSDFGQSRPLVDTTAVHNMGTHLWAAPEVLAEDGHSKKSDVWSLGCTAVELVSLKEPYHHMHQGDRRMVRRILRQVESKELDPLVDLSVTWPPGLEEIVQRCLRTNHTERPSMEDVLKYLTDTISPASGHNPSSPQKAIYFCSWNPHGLSEERTLSLTVQETFREALNSSRDLFSVVPPSRGVICFSQEGRYLLDGELRSHVECYNTIGNNFPDIDVEHGREVTSNTRTLFILRFFDDRSDLPRSPSLVPRVFIYNDAELLQMRGRSVQAAPEGALGLERFIAFLYGVKSGAEEPQFFWRITGDEGGDPYVSPAGDIVAGESAITGPADRKFFWLLLRDKDQLPIVRLPRRRYLVVYHRLGAKIDITENRLVASPAPFPSDLERWEQSSKISDFDEKMSAAASGQ